MRMKQYDTSSYQSGDSPQDERRVVATEAEGIGDSDRNGVTDCVMRDVAEHRTVRVCLIEIDRRRQHLTFESDQASGGFHSGGGAQQMARHALGRTDRNVADRVAEYRLQDACLTDITDAGRSGMSVDVAEFTWADTGISQRLLHGGDPLRRFRTGDDEMMGVAGPAEAGDLGIATCLSCAGIRFSFEDEEGTAVAENHAIAVFLERSRRECASPLGPSSW